MSFVCLLTDKNDIITDFEIIKQAVFDTVALEAERDELQNELNIVVKLSQKCVQENAASPSTKTSI